MAMSDDAALHAKQVKAWCVYDWSTNGYQVTTASALFPVFFVQAIAPQGADIWNIHIPPAGLWAGGIGLAAIVVFLMAPVLGAIADYTCLKKPFLMAFAWSGSLFASLLFFATPGMVWVSLLLFVFAQICYTSGNVLYDAFLPQLAEDDKVDRISGLGFAYGYVGGGLQFGLALGLVSGHEWLGLSQSTAIRLALLMAGLWWLGFSAYTFIHLKETRPAAAGAPRRARLKPALRTGVRRTWETIRRLPRFPAMLLFLVAFFLYNDGIQTVISISAAYGGAELGLEPQIIMVTFLIVQFIAFFGALVFSRLAGRIGTKEAILISLTVWCGVVIYAYFLQRGDAFGFMILGMIVGLVLGGSQALSRSLFASMIPREAAANFFGFYSVFNKLSAIAGPVLFALLTTVFGSARPAILALIFFFVVGGVLLYFVDVTQARKAKGLWKFDGGNVRLE